VNAPAATPLVSIITPAYNAERFLVETVESVRKQTYTHWEHIIVNDGSKDGTLALAHQLAAEDSRIRVLTQANQGVSVTRNHGMAEAKGDIIALLDADDTWEPQNLERKVNVLLTKPDVDWVFGDVNVCDEQLQNPEPLHAFPTNDIVRSILLWEGDIVPGPCSNLTFRRKCLEAGVRFDPRFSTAADQDISLQLASRFKGEHIPELLWNYRVLGNSMSRNVRLMEHDHLLVYQKALQNGLFSTPAFKRECFANLYLILAGSWWVNGGNKPRAVGFALRALAQRPVVVFKLADKLRKRLLKR